MTIKEITEAIEKKKIVYGIKQTLKQKKNLVSVFVSKDVRDETINKLEAASIEFTILKTKKELTKQLNLDFESEVFGVLK